MNEEDLTKQTVHEPGRDLPVDARCDVVVVGGGIAGVSAALAAARQGMEVVLIEKQFGLGGLATLGNVIVYLPLCDGNGRQVMGGIAEELLHLSVAELRGGGLPKAHFTPVPDCWTGPGTAQERSRKRLMSSFNPYAFQLAMERLIQAEGVSLMYDSRVCQVIKTPANQLSHVIVENKSGRLAIEARMFIDASGDADLCVLAGCDVECFPNNVLAGWHYEIQDNEVKLIMLSNAYDKEHGRGNKAQGPFFDGTNHRDVTAHVLQTRNMLWQRMEKNRQANPSQAVYPFGIPSIPCFRMTRRLVNAFSLGERHRHVWFDDCVGFTSDWRRRGPVYPITLSSIQADQCVNLFATGRCLSADSTLVDVTRAIPTCALSGEAAGIACAILIRQNSADGKVPIARLQELMIDAGNPLDPELLREIAPPVNVGGDLAH